MVAPSEYAAARTVSPRALSHVPRRRERVVRFNRAGLYTWFMAKTHLVIDETNALPGRSTPTVVTRPHLTLGVSMLAPYPNDTDVAFFGMGCFWGAERVFFQIPGVYVTAVGYQGGFTPNATYQEVCTGRTGHGEIVQVVYRPSVISYAELVKCFYESHDPTQGDRQGGDVGTQYRSALYVRTDAQRAIAERVTTEFETKLREVGYGSITTEIAMAGPFYFAEEYHQQYLVANPNGYCGIGGTGVSCPIGLTTT